MGLKHSPYTIFKGSRTPFALYARKRWMDEGSVKLKGLTERLLDSICKKQDDNGSWRNSVVRTVENLYILSLLGPEKVDTGARGVDWLLEKEHPTMVHTSGDGSPYTGLFFRMSRDDVRQVYERRDLPFNRGCSGFFKTGAALYFSGIFGKEKDRRVTTAFRSLDQVLKIRGDRWCSLACSNNILRGYVSHPAKGNSSQTRKALKYLERFQSEGGDWEGTPFFYHTFNTIAQSRMETAQRQIRRAMPRIARSQNRDGSWGRSNPEFCTFMVLDGLERQEMLNCTQ